MFKKARNIVIAALLLTNLSMFTACRRSGEPQAISNQLNPDKATSAVRGEQIVAEHLRRDAAPYRKCRLRLTISSLNDAVKTYELEVFRKQTDDQTITLTQIIQPTSENDLASLSVERKGQNAVNITYSAGTGRFRETGTNKMFFGGLTTQELLGAWDKYDYRLIDEKEADGIKVYEVEGTIKPSADSVIARSITLFRSDSYQPTELRLFGSDGRKLRTYQVKDYGSSAGRTFAVRTEIENHVRSTKIDVEILSLTFPDRIADEMFTRDWLKRKAEEKKND